jgi:YbbR domain-containing protein
MKKTLLVALLFAFVGVSNAQNPSINHVLQSRGDVTKPPTSGWFQLVSDKQVEDLKFKPIQVFQVSLNATTDVLTVSQPSDKATAGVWQIFDSNDTLRWSQKVNEKDIEMPVNIQSLSEGVYFVSFMVDGQKRFTQKLIKIKSN